MMPDLPHCSRFGRFFLIAALAALPGNVVNAASAASVTFVSGTTNFGSNTGPVTLQYYVSPSFSLTTPLVVTQGVTGGDFEMTGGTCVTGFAGGSCNVVVTFTPSLPGLRMGAVLFLDPGNNVVATTYLAGVGQGSLPILSTGVTKFIPPLVPISVAVDGGENIYLGGEGADNGVQTYGLWNLAGNMFATYAFAGASAIVLDGAGYSYVSDPVSNCVWKTTPVGLSITAATVCLSPPSGAVLAGALAVDGFANLYVADSASGEVLEFVPSSGNWGSAAACGYGSCVNYGPSNTSWPGTPFAAIGVDGAANLYIATAGGGACYAEATVGTGGAGYSAAAFAAIACDGAVWRVSNSVRGTPAQWTSIWQGTGTGYYGTTRAQSLALDGAGTVYVIDSINNLWKVPQGPWPYTTSQTQQLVDTKDLGLDGWSPWYIAMDGPGNAYVTDSSFLCVFELGGANFITTTVTIHSVISNCAYSEDVI